MLAEVRSVDAVGEPFDECSALVACCPQLRQSVGIGDSQSAGSDRATGAKDILSGSTDQAIAGQGFVTGEDLRQESAQCSSPPFSHRCCSDRVVFLAAAACSIFMRHIFDIAILPALHRLRCRSHLVDRPLHCPKLFRTSSLGGTESPTVPPLLLFIFNPEGASSDATVEVQQYTPQVLYTPPSHIILVTPSGLMYVLFLTNKLQSACGRINRLYKCHCAM